METGRLQEFLPDDGDGDVLGRYYWYDQQQDLKVSSLTLVISETSYSQF